MKNFKLPSDLTFIESFDIANAKKNLIDKYSQETPKTSFQLELQGKQFSGQIKDYLPMYGIKEQNLHLVYQKLVEQAQKNGVAVEYMDLTGFSEDEYYGNEFENDPDHEKHAETARSDGKTLVLEQDLSKAGSITGRMYDLIHLAFGHLVQWSTSDSRALLTKEEAWSVGYRNHEQSPDMVLDLMALYEFEAGMMGVNAVQRTLATMSEISADQKERIIQYFTDYVYTDSKFIIQHYRGNKNKFESYFLPAQGVPPVYGALSVLEYIERHAVEIGLLRDKQKQTA